jgi:DNA-binding NarL/FixJ family response regulator
MTLRLLIVDNNAQFLVAARCLLTSEGIDVVGVASTTADALRYSRSLRPDVILVDVDLGEESGFDLAEKLTSDSDGATQRVILTSAYSEQDLADLIEESPAVGFLPKTRLSASAILDLIDDLDATGDHAAG